MKKPYLIQRGTINDQLANENARLSHAVALDYDYMGSAEVEFGALPASFRRIQAKADDWRLHTAENFAGGSETLRIWGAFPNEDQFQEYLGFLIDIRTKNFKERSNFDLSSIDFHRRMGFASQEIDFWWDIQNDVMWTFHKIAGNRIGHWVASSLVFMDTVKSSS